MQRNNDQTQIKVLFNDNFILAVYKPRGIDFHTEKNNLIKLVKEQVQPSVYPVHRLDKDVDGIVLFAKNNHIANLIVQQFKSRQIEKIYLAIIDSPLTKTVLIKRPIMLDKTILKAETFVWPVEVRKDLTLVKVAITTGRFHQIKIHLKEANLKLLKDSFGSFLSSVFISLIHPRTKRRILITFLRGSETYKTWLALTDSKIKLTVKSLLKW
ncbi:MAG: pseudouridine synthase [Deltaproteobacteria bacterium]|nr:pseudouridine synthase [Deltaproteobacteria bacterium]